MFPNEIRERLLQLDHNKIIVMESGGTIALDERKAGGEAMLHVEGINPYVAFCHVDDGRWPYLKHRTCADHFILEYKDKVWYLHVLEFKRTVTTGGWEHIKEQFKGGYFQRGDSRRILRHTHRLYEYNSLYVPQGGSDQEAG